MDVASWEGGNGLNTVSESIVKFHNEMILWNFDSALSIVSKFEDFPRNAIFLLKDLACSFGNCGCCRFGIAIAYAKVPKKIDTIMGEIEPWLKASMKGGRKKARKIRGAMKK